MLFIKICKFPHIFCFCIFKQFFSKMQLMLPLVIRADNGFYGAEDWATRLAIERHSPKPLETYIHSFFRWRVIGQGALGGFLLLAVMQAVSRYVSYMISSIIAVFFPQYFHFAFQVTTGRLHSHIFLQSCHYHDSILLPTQVRFLLTPIDCCCCRINFL